MWEKNPRGKRDRHIEIYLNAVELKALQKFSDEIGITISAICRASLLSVYACWRRAKRKGGCVIRHRPNKIQGEKPSPVYDISK